MFKRILDIKELNRGDIIRHISGGKTMVVDALFGEFVIAVNTCHISNPVEWEIFKSQESNKNLTTNNPAEQISLEDIKMSTRLYNCLQMAIKHSFGEKHNISIYSMPNELFEIYREYVKEYTTLGGVVNTLSRKKLFRERNFGYKSFQELERILSVYDLSLKDN